MSPEAGTPQAIVDRTEELVCEAKRSGDEFDQVWWVFDVESPTPHPRIEAIVAKAERLGYRCAISHPCFELWLMLHFRAQTAALSSAGAERLVKECGCGYEDKHFDFGKVWPNYRRAVDHAVALHGRQVEIHPRSILNRNPWTSVHELVLELVSLGETSR